MHNVINGPGTALGVLHQLLARICVLVATILQAPQVIQESACADFHGDAE
ncbi:hypothetical protein [Corynebacterium lizhenjunii]|nr:hypothetical protein [Corynebacterium lizhenjunii]